MNRFKRPEEPDDFAAATAEHKEAARLAFTDHIASGSSAGLKYEFVAVWREFKPHFMKAQHSKCGYCERDVASNQDGDVEHFHPKGAIWSLDPKTPRSKARIPNSGRYRTVVSPIGYWHLAYEWSNYLLACSLCNRNAKGSYFPVSANPRMLPPTVTCSEVSLLLNPFCEIHDPTDHLSFDSTGQISALNGSLQGFETIRTCELDRNGLRAVREKIALRAFYLINRISTDTRADRDMAELCVLGMEDREHCGMVRSIIQEHLGVSWQKLFDVVPKEAFEGWVKPL